MLWSRLLPVVLIVLPIGRAQTEQQYIDTVNSAISAEQTAIAGLAQPRIIIGANLVFANGSLVASMPATALVSYVDGLKAAGVQRVEMNPGITSLTQPGVEAFYDAMVRHSHELGMWVAFNPEFTKGELTVNTFADFQSAALAAYQQLALQYQPDNFVIVHEPDTMAGRMGITTTVQDWHDFIVAAAPMIKAVSPHTRVGAGCFFNSSLPTPINASENAYFKDFATIPELDFLTIDAYSADFDTFTAWAQLAHTNGKGVYIEETWAPHDLPIPLPLNWYTMGSLDNVATLGATDPDFAQVDQDWLQLMAKFASANGMEAMTAFTSETFFMYGNPPGYKTSDMGYISSLAQSLQKPSQLTATGQGYQKVVSQSGVNEAISVSSASFATLPSFFCTTNPCNPETVVSPGSLATAFGVDLANTTALDGSFPTSLGGTTVKILDKSNTTYPVQLYFASAGQVNYYVPGKAMAGPATITIMSGDGTVSEGVVRVAQVMPGLYTADSSGKGAAAAIAICSGTCAGWPNKQANGQYFQDTFQCAGDAGCQPVPISVAASDTVVLELFGTGIRNVPGVSSVTLQINGQTLPVLFAGPQGDTGLDQVNVQLPSSMGGAGTVNVVLTALGVAANTVTIAIQ